MVDSKMESPKAKQQDTKNVCLILWCNLEKAASRESALWSLQGFVKEMDTFSVLQMHFGEILMCLGQIHIQ